MPISINGSGTIVGPSPTSLGTSAANSIFVDSSGNLGVGTNSPLYATSNRTVVGINGSSTSVISLSSGNSLSTSGYLYWDGTNFQVAAGGSTPSLTFATNGAERMRIDASGNLGLGVTPSAWGSGIRAFQLLGGWGSIASNNGNGNFEFAGNAYLNSSGNWIFINAFGASRYTINNAANGSHVWYSYSGTPSVGGTISWTQVMTLDSSGNLGLGTSTTSWPSSYRGFDFLYCSISNTGTGAVPFYFTQNGYYNGTNWITRYTGPSKRYELSDNGHIWYHGASVTGGTAITYTQQMTLDSSGALNINNTTALTGDAKLSIWNVSGQTKGFATGYGTSAGQFRLIYLTNTANSLLFDNGSNVATLSSAGAWTNASDARIKKNIVDIKYGLETILKSQPRSFERVDVDGKYIGFIAQEMENIIPEVVSGDPEKQLCLDYGSLVAVSFKAIQELSAKLDEANERIKALESK